MIFVWLAFCGAFLPGGICRAGPLGPVPQWIWLDPLPRQQQTAFFRRTFRVDFPVRSVELRGLADDEMIVWLNGRRAAHVADARRMHTADVTQLIRNGANVVSVRAKNVDGPAGVLLQLRLVGHDGRETFVDTDSRWFGSDSAAPGWKSARYQPDGWRQIHSFGLWGVSPWGQRNITDDYHQWREALDTGGATEAGSLRVVPGFRVDLVRSARPEEDSWVSMAFDDRGRIIVGREKRGLLRMTLTDDQESVAHVELIDDTLQECRGLLYAFDSLYADANVSKGLYRLRDTDGDDRYDEVRLLKQTPGGTGHGRNDLVLGPDEKIYVVHGNNVEVPPGVAASSPLGHLASDRLRPCTWDRLLFDSGVEPPAGHILRTDPDDSKWELFAGGFRNTYSADFSPDGELFTFDADNEGDLNQPWYRPVRINHVVSGGDYGFRQGTANRPEFYPDQLPANLNVGIGSPTGVKFGTRSRFPEKYRRALFVQDWSYGRIFAVHLTPRGASYAASAETFLEGRPLSLTDLDFGPDGAMYFVTGGRGTQSGLYRVEWIGTDGPDRSSDTHADADFQRTTTAENEQAAADRALRRKLESLHGRQDPQTVDAAWPHLDASDPWIRHAARIAVEHQPVATWQARALAEARPTAAWTALLALSRAGSAELRPLIVARLLELSGDAADPGRLLGVVRTYAVCFARMGRADQAAAERIIERLGPLFPTGCDPVDRLLCELLVYLDAPNVVERTMQLVESAATPHERLFYLYVLRNVRTGWSPGSRDRYFRWLSRSDEFEGGNMLPLITNSMKLEALAWLSDGEREQAAAILFPAESPGDNSEREISPRPFVREWTPEDLADSLPDVGQGRSFGRGRKMFAQAACDRCHRFADRGPLIGPDLTGVARRFGRKDLLESILRPSKVVDEKYRNVMITTDGGKLFVGRIVGGDDRHVILSTDPLQPRQLSRIANASILEQKPSLVSPMPKGLLDSLSREEILELLAYLESDGVEQHPLFQPSAGENAGDKDVGGGDVGGENVGGDEDAGGENIGGEKYLGGTE